MKKIIFLLSIFITFGANAIECNVSGYSSLQGCIANGNIINLQSDIVLNVRERIYINNIDGLTINGNGHTIRDTEERFKDNKTEYFLLISGNSKNIFIKNTTFKTFDSFMLPTYDKNKVCANGGNQNINPNEPMYQSPSCHLIGVLESSLIEFNNNQFLNYTTDHLVLRNVSNIKIIKNIFKEAATWGIFMMSSTNSYSMSMRNLTITDNKFERIGGNAIIVNSLDTAWIGNNTFIDNHHLTQFGGYDGGQILFEANDKFDTKNVDITGNSIEAIANNNSHGVEFASFNRGKGIYNVSVRYNRIIGNRHGAVKFDSSDIHSIAKNVSIINNEFLSNSNGIFYSQIIKSAFDDVTIGNNWAESSAVKGKASFDGTATTCKLGLTSALDAYHCTINLKWNLNFTPAKEVRIAVRSVGTLNGDCRNQSLFAYVGASGVADFPYVDKNGVVVELYYANDFDLNRSDCTSTRSFEVPIASITLRAVN